MMHLGAVHFGPYRLLPEQRILLNDGGPVPLGARAFNLLLALLDRHQTVVSKDELMGLVWHGQIVEENTLAVHLSALRKALGDGGGGFRYIATVSGRGYKFVAPVETVSAISGSRPTEARRADPPQITNLPQAEGPIFGREDALARLIAALKTARLVTLTGPGGIGKTRLALAAGQQLGRHFPDGVWWIDLSPLRDGALVAGTVARVLGLRLGDSPPLARLGAALSGKRQLLILDNCEHVAASAAELAVALGETSDTRLLTTSLEPLAVAGERVERLEPLELPSLDGADLDAASSAPAVQLFVTRARAVSRNFALDRDNVRTVVDVCRRLDGVPLAIELAASRAALLGPEAVARRLDARLLDLSGRRRDVLPKHQTLRALLDWSHGLLAKAERVVLRRLAVFVGGCTLDAVEAVVADDLVPDWQVAGHVASLIGKSLLIAEHTALGARYRLLETTWTYASERLAASGEAEVVGARHARYVVNLFEEAVDIWERTPDIDWLRRYGPEIDNSRAALAWTFADPQRAPVAVTLASSTALYWATLGLHGEGRRYVDQAIDLMGDTMPPAAAARLLRRAAVLRLNSDRPQAMGFAERSLDFSRQTGDDVGEAQTLGIIGTLLLNLGRHDEARIKLFAAYDALSNKDQNKSLGNFANSLGILSGMTNQLDEARRWFLRAVECAEATGYAGLEILGLLNLAETEFMIGEVASAIQRTRMAIPEARAQNRLDLLALGLTNLTGYLLAQDAAEEARPVAAEAFARLRDEGGHQLTSCLETWATIGAIEGRFRAAAPLIGYTNISWTRTGEQRDPASRQRHERLVERLEAALPAAEIETAMTEGAGWTEQQAAAFTADRLISRHEA